MSQSPNHIEELLDEVQILLKDLGIKITKKNSSFPYLESRLTHLTETVREEERKRIIKVLTHSSRTFIWDAQLDQDDFENLVKNREALLQANIKAINER